MRYPEAHEVVRIGEGTGRREERPMMLHQGSVLHGPRETVRAVEGEVEPFDSLDHALVEPLGDRAELVLGDGDARMLLDAGSGSIRIAH
mgnify:CR=1 FL=1